MIPHSWHVARSAGQHARAATHMEKCAPAGQPGCTQHVPARARSRCLPPPLPLLPALWRRRTRRCCSHCLPRLLRPTLYPPVCALPRVLPVPRERSQRLARRLCMRLRRRLSLLVPHLTAHHLPQVRLCSTSRCSRRPLGQLPPRRRPRWPAASACTSPTSWHVQLECVRSTCAKERATHAVCCIRVGLHHLLADRLNASHVPTMDTA